MNNNEYTRPKDCPTSSCFGTECENKSLYAVKQLKLPICQAETVYRLYVQTWSEELFISPTIGLICHKHLALPRKKWRQEVVYCNGRAESEETWSGIRRTIHSTAHLPLSATVFRHTHAHTQTYSYTANQSPLIGKIAFKGTEENYSTLFLLRHFVCAVKVLICYSTNRLIKGEKSITTQ